jgi:hypothetical protein
MPADISSGLTTSGYFKRPDFVLCGILTALSLCACTTETINKNNPIIKK